MKHISLVQVQPPTVAPTLTVPFTSTVVQPDAQLTQIDEEMMYIKSEPQIISSLPSTSTTLIIPTSTEPPNELIVSDIKEEDIQIGTNVELNLLTNSDEILLSSLDAPPVEGTDESIDSTEIKMEEVLSG